MQVTVVPHAGEIIGISGKTAVVIDVLRATSTMVTAFANGATAVMPFFTPEEAKQYYGWHNNKLLLCGERKGVKITGFHLGNSPLEYTGDVVAGKTLLMTTTNGTKAIKRSETAGTILIGSALNAPAVADQLLRLHEDVVLVCAGTRERFSLDDFAVAGLILCLLRERVKLAMDDRARAACLLAESREMRELLLMSNHGQYLVELGFTEDIEYCAQVGKINLVPYFDGKMITI